MTFGQQHQSIDKLPSGSTTAHEINNESEPIAAELITTQSLNEPLLNESEAARFLGISRMTLLRKRNAGEIKFFRVGYRVLYSKEKHLLPFLTECEKSGEKQNSTSLR